MSAWASKLSPRPDKDANKANAGSGNLKKKQVTPPAQTPKVKVQDIKPETIATPATASASPSLPFNSDEVLQYLHRNFQKNLANANTLNETRVYNSLEGSSQWKTKPQPNNKKPYNNPKYNPRAVIRSDQKSNNIDLLFELNRSIYQQQNQNQNQSQNQNRTYQRS